MSLQNEILNKIHVDPETGSIQFIMNLIASMKENFILGLHVGIKKMHQVLQKTHFWRYSNRSIANFINNCSSCKTTCEVPEPTVNCSKPKSTVVPWDEIEMHCLGPIQPLAEKDQQYLAIIYDPVSRWISAEPIENKADMAVFLFENFCNHGAAICYTFGVDENEFEDLKQR